MRAQTKDVANAQRTGQPIKDARLAKLLEEATPTSGPPADFSAKVRLPCNASIMVVDSADPVLWLGGMNIRHSPANHVCDLAVSIASKPGLEQKYCLPPAPFAHEAHMTFNAAMLCLHRSHASAIEPANSVLSNVWSCADRTGRSDGVQGGLAKARAVSDDSVTGWWHKLSPPHDLLVKDPLVVSRVGTVEIVLKAHTAAS